MSRVFIISNRLAIPDPKSGDKAKKEEGAEIERQFRAHRGAKINAERHREEARASPEVGEPAEQEHPTYSTGNIAACRIANARCTEAKPGALLERPGK